MNLDWAEIPIATVLKSADSKMQKPCAVRKVRSVHMWLSASPRLGPRFADEAERGVYIQEGFKI
jgi:hypothetical protein